MRVRQGAEQRLGEAGDVVERLGGGEASARAVDPDAVEHVPAEADGRDGDRVDGELDGDDDGAGRLRR